MSLASEVSGLSHEEVEKKLIEFMRTVLRLGDDVPLDATTNLIEQVGLDSIEAFDAVATLHEIMNQSIRDDFNPKVVGTVRDLGNYLLQNYPEESIEALIAADLSAIREQWELDE
jgi:acyl carrier protein